METFWQQKKNSDSRDNAALQCSVCRDTSGCSTWTPRIRRFRRKRELPQRKNPPAMKQDFEIWDTCASIYEGDAPVPWNCQNERIYLHDDDDDDDDAVHFCQHAGTRTSHRSSSLLDTNKRSEMDYMPCCSLAVPGFATYPLQYRGAHGSLPRSS